MCLSRRLSSESPAGLREARSGRLGVDHVTWGAGLGIGPVLRRLRRTSLWSGRGLNQTGTFVGVGGGAVAVLFRMNGGHGLLLAHLITKRQAW